MDLSRDAFVFSALRDSVSPCENGGGRGGVVSHGGTETRRGDAA